MPRVHSVEFRVRDGAIHCTGCEVRIETVLRKVPGVLRVKADHRTQKVSLTLDAERVSEEEIRRRLAEMGYEADTAGPA